MRCKKSVGLHPITYCQLREITIIRFSRCRVFTQRPRTTVMRTQDVGTHDEIFLRIKKSSLLYSMRPPVSDITVRCQRVAHPHNIVTTLTKTSKGVIGYFHTRQNSSKLKLEILFRTKKLLLFQFLKIIPVFNVTKLQLIFDSDNSRLHFNKFQPSSITKIWLCHV